MNIYKLAVDTLSDGKPPKDYREATELWIRINPETHVPAFQECVRAARMAQSENVGFYKPKTRAKASETPHRLGFKAPASLMRFLEMYDPDVLANDTKYQKLKRQLPMLDCGAKYTY